jgi:hypothetical protein
MTRARPTLYVLLAIVAAAAAVLSFSALRDLAALCGFSPALAPLLPVVLDAGAAAGSLAWLAPWTPPAARAYGRALALALLAASVGGNALGHGLEAFGVAPAWWVVVGVSAISPAVLGALVHLTVVAGRPPARTVADLVAERDTETPSVPPTPPPTEDPNPGESPTRVTLHLAPAPSTPGDDVETGTVERVAGIVAEGGGRRTVMKELGVSEYEARKLLERARA